MTSEMKAGRPSMYIGGEWIDSASGETFERISPVTGEVLASLPKANREDAQAAVDAANQARSHMASMPVFERAALCHAIADVLESKHKSMGEELSLEQGKPYREACDEILFAAELYRMPPRTSSGWKRVSFHRSIPTSASSPFANRTAWWR